MAHDPLSPSEALLTPIGAVLTAVSLFVLLYSVVIVAQVLLGLLIGVALPIGLYLSYRTLSVLDSIADAAQRFADIREREADEASRFGSPTERDSSASQSSDRITERER
ncbi:hypothetical protein [Halorubrum sp. CSM-61]|uniref:hypothetical protein n=1 Tax=Halorubrum sp. CSM-61 TaxID=2485838 RepID=UPI000F4CF292|nr:hypothetical protein [Halorubrum sp. CSM-61]